MNAARVHLLLNHVPVIGTLIAVGLLAVGLFWKRDALVRAAVGVFVAAALFAAPRVSVAGNRRKDVVEDLPGISKKVIERHEDAAAARWRWSGHCLAPRCCAFAAPPPCPSRWRAPGWHSA